jgi:multidrug efflux pump subunit AcrA (membrane-fusion protein)
MLALAIGVMLLTRPIVADNQPPAAKDKDKEKEKGSAAAAEAVKPELVKVEKGPLTDAVVLKGIVQSEEATELSVRLKSWTGQLVARKAVEHGAAVKAGDVVVEFEADKLDLAIRDAREERELAQLAIRLAELELPILEKQTPLEIAVAERDHKEAVEDMKRFVDIERKTYIQMAEFMLKSSNFYAEFARDEMKQLQKMYRDKDLTEETEQMILKRYKHNVEQSEFFASLAKLDSEKTLKIELPRREQTLKTAVEKSELALAKAREVQPVVLKQKRLALEHLRFEDKKARERVAELEADRAALTVKAPVDGLAYHGRFVGGQWMVPAGSQGPALMGVGQINPGDVFLTVMSPGKASVRAEVEEKELAGLKAGLTGRLTPTAYPDKKLPCELTRVARAPHEGKFVVAVKLTGPAEELVPGMTCSIRFVTAKKADALTVPATAVFEDVAEDVHYVWVPTKDGKHVKKAVTVGITSGDRTEIVKGLAAGEEVYSAKP